MNSNSLADPSYSITCGTAKKLENTFEIIKVGTNIPFVTDTQNPDFYFGCTIEDKKSSSESNTGFTSYAKLTLPKSSSSIYQSGIGHAETIVNDSLVITTEPLASNKINSMNRGFLVFQFDESDSPGIYKMNIYVNNALQKKVTFTVSK